MNPWTLTKTGVMRFWYWYVRKLNHAWPYRTIDGKRFAIHPGVYKPLENEHACFEYCREGETVLDVGTGCGVAAIMCAPKAKSVLAVDISDAALRNTEANCRTFGIDNVKVRQSDMLSNVDGKFELIIANPPYIGVDFDDAEEQFATSTRYVPTLFRQANDRLEVGGRILVQWPRWYRGHLETVASQNGFTMVSMKLLPLKDPLQWLLSLVYMQVGFLSTFYLFERAAAVRVPVNSNEKSPVSKLLRAEA